MNETYDIFISYSSRDRETVEAYVQALKDAGYKVWYDSDGLHGGDEFSKVIAQALDASRLVVFFSSEHSNKSVSKSSFIFCQRIPNLSANTIKHTHCIVV